MTKLLIKWFYPILHQLPVGTLEKWLYDSSFISFISKSFLFVYSWKNGASNIKNFHILSLIDSFNIIISMMSMLKFQFRKKRRHWWISSDSSGFYANLILKRYIRYIIMSVRNILRSITLLRYLRLSAPCRC